MKMQSKTLLLLALSILPAIAAADPGPEWREATMNGSGSCQPALPRYDGEIRKRPLAVVNEGVRSSFVTCALPIDLANEEGVASFYGVLRNFTAQTVTVTCTGVYGVDNGEAVYSVKTRTLQPGTRVRLTWEPDDFGRNRLRDRVGFSCSLPVLTGINEVGTIEKL